MPDLISAAGHVAVFTGIAEDGTTRFHARPLLAWTVGDDGRLVGHYINANGQTAVASGVPNFYRYMTDNEWEPFFLRQLSLASPRKAAP
ncbi:DUF6253 family protein [Streptomyces sp. NPDC052109]|uniref:DUF6253 family protein n=1 Tax=Streptomyces sp. NPDC052109 TaxID=3155527 RepID=UPI0034290181